MMIPVPVRAALLVVGTALSVSTVMAQPGSVSGTLTVNGTTVAVRHVTAVTYDTPSPGRLISVLVSDKPVTEVGK